MKFGYMICVLLAIVGTNFVLTAVTIGRPYKFGFTIDEQQHRREQKDERGIVMGEFGFITADGIYHVTVYATDEDGKFRIISMKNFRYNGPIGTKDSPESTTLKSTTTTTTTTATAPLATPPRYNFNTEACSGCFLNKTPVKPATSVGTATGHGTGQKTVIRTLSQPLPAIAETGPGIVGNEGINVLLPFESSIAQAIEIATTHGEPPVSGHVKYTPAHHTKIEYNVGVPPAPAPAPTTPHEIIPIVLSKLESIDISNLPKIPPASPQPSLTNVNYNLESNKQTPAAGGHLIDHGGLVPITSVNVGAGEIHLPHTEVYSPPINTHTHDDHRQIKPHHELEQNLKVPTQHKAQENAQYTTPIQTPTQHAHNHQHHEAESTQTVTSVQHANGNSIGGAFKPVNSPSGVKTTTNSPSSISGSTVTGATAPTSNKNFSPPAPHNVAAQNGNAPGSASGSHIGKGSSTSSDIGDLYRFKYTLDYNGHEETGGRNGNKEGKFFAIGDDSVQRNIEYIANEFGYQPHIRWQKIDLSELPKENTLKDYEFKWFH